MMLRLNKKEIPGGWSEKYDKKRRRSIYQKKLWLFVNEAVSLVWWTGKGFPADESGEKDKRKDRQRGKGKGLWRNRSKN